MKTVQDMVMEFHTTYKVPVGGKPALLTDRLPLRMGLIDEEVAELRDACSGGDLVEAADALGDIIYVVYGMAIEMGIDLDAVLREIHLSNLSKLGEDGKPIYRADNKVLKGPNYFKPNIARALGFGA